MAESDELQTLRERHFAANQTVFRRSNERLSLQRKDVSAGPRGYVCECGDDSCSDLVSLAPGEYEHIRSSSTWFLIARDHEILASGAERIVETHELYQIAEKSGRAGALAEAMDTLAASRQRSV